MKTCTKCDKRKKLTRFYKNRYFKDGYNYWCKICCKEYRLNNKKELKIYDKKYREKNKKIKQKYQKNWLKNHKKQQQTYQKKHRNIPKIKIQRKKYYQKYIKQYLSKIENKIVHTIRIRINNALKRMSKNTSTIKLLDCSIQELKKHLQNQFKKGMTWKNYGLYGWHIDHIKPCASFDLSNFKEQRECFHYTNLQPLWAEENLIKGSNNGSWRK